MAAQLLHAQAHREAMQQQRLLMLQQHAANHGGTPMQPAMLFRHMFGQQVVSFDIIPSRSYAYDSDLIWVTLMMPLLCCIIAWAEFLYRSHPCSQSSCFFWWY
jgi:hypothetical protein